MATAWSTFTTSKMISLSWFKTDESIVIISNIRPCGLTIMEKSVLSFTNTGEILKSMHGFNLLMNRINQLIELYMYILLICHEVDILKVGDRVDSL